MVSTNFNRTARVRETSPGVIPGSPAFEYCFLKADSFKPSKVFKRSETITGVRGIKEHIAVGEAFEGNADFEWAFGYIDWAWELSNFDNFNALEEAYNVTADSNITQVTASTQTMLAAGAWKVGMLLRTTGLTTAGNNKRFRAAAGTGSGTIVAPASTFAADDATPAAGARVVCVGIEGASGDISATASGLASAANVFLNMPLLPGMGIKIGGETAGTFFSNVAANNAFVPIKSIAADGSAIELDELPAGWGVDNGSGKTIQIFIGDDSRTADDVLTDCVQAWNTKTSPLWAERFDAVACQTLGLTLPLNDIVTGQVGVVGFGGGLITALLDAAPDNPLIGVGDVMKTGSNIARLTEGGVAIASGIECQGMTWRLGNNLTPVGDLTKDRAIEWNPGDRTIEIEGTYRAKVKTILEKFYNGTQSRQFFVVYRGGYAYMVRLLAGTYTDYERPVQGRNGEWTTKMKLEAIVDPVTNLLNVTTRFREWK